MEDACPRIREAPSPKGSAMNRKVQVRDDRSPRDVSVDLERFTVFVDANGSGKTSILEAIHDAVGAAADDPRKVFAHRRHCDWLYTRGGSGDLRITCDFGQSAAGRVGSRLILGRGQVGGDGSRAVGSPRSSTAIHLLARGGLDSDASAPIFSFRRSLAGARASRRRWLAGRGVASLLHSHPFARSRQEEWGARLILGRGRVAGEGPDPFFRIPSPLAPRPSPLAPRPSPLPHSPAMASSMLSGAAAYSRGSIV